MRQRVLFLVIATLTGLLTVFQNCAKGARIENAGYHTDSVLGAGKASQSLGTDGFVEELDANPDEVSSDQKAYILKSYVNASGRNESKSVFVYSVTATVDLGSGTERFTISEPAKDCNTISSICTQYLQDVFTCSEISTQMACLVSVEGRETDWKYEVSSFYYLPKTVRVERSGSFMKISDVSSKSYAVLEEVTSDIDTSGAQIPNVKLIQDATTTQVNAQGFRPWIEFKEETF